MQVGDPILAEDVLIARLSSSFALATSSTTLQDVTGLSVSVPASSIYIVDVMIAFIANSSTPDIKIGFTFPSALLRLGAVGGSAINTSGVASDLSMAFGTFTSGSTVRTFAADTGTAATVIMRGILDIGTAGTFQVQAAQNASSADTVTVQSASYLLLTRVS